MSKLWNESGVITAWTNRDGPGRVPPGPRRLPWTLGAGWIGLFVAGVAWGCPAEEAGVTPVLPMWAMIVDGFFFTALLGALPGLFLRRPFGAVLSVAAALLALPLSVSEYPHAAWWGVLLASTAVVFLVWSVAVLVAMRRYARDSALALAEQSSVSPVDVPPAVGSRMPSVQPERVREQ